MSELDVQAVLDSVAADLGVAVVLEDVDFRLLAHTDHGGLMDEVRRSSILGRRASASVRAWFEQCGILVSEDPVRTPANSSLGALERWCVPVRYRSTHLGYVWVLDGGRIPSAHLAPVVEAAHQIGALLYRRRLSTQVDADLLRLLLMANPEADHVAAEARATGVHTYRGPIAVVLAGLADGQEPTEGLINDLALAVQRAAEKITSDRVLSGVISGLGVVLAPIRLASDVAPAKALAESVCRLALYFNEELKLVAAVGGGVDLDYADRSYAEARRALRLARAMPDLGPLVAWDDLGVFRALVLLPPDQITNGVLDSRVRGLLANRELALTAEAFLDLAGNVQATANRLFLHRATLYQRLDRIQKVYDLDLRRNGDHRLLAHLGLKLARLASL